MNEIATIQQNPSVITLREKIEEAITESKQILVMEESQIETAGFYIKKYGELDKKIESLRKDLVKPLNDEVKNINSFFKDLQGSFIPEQERLKKETNEILAEVRKRQAEQKAKEQKELEEALLDEAEMFNDESVLDNIPKVEFKQTKIAENNLTTVRTKKWKVTDIDKVPRKFLIVDEKLINTMRKDYDYEDKSPIEGIEFYFDETVRIK